MILNYKKLYKKIGFKYLNEYYGLVNKDNYVDAIDDYLCDSELYEEEVMPKTRQNHVGIEIECFGEISSSHLFGLFIEEGIEDLVSIGEDASIDPDYGDMAYEIRIIIPQKNLKSVFKKLDRVFKKADLHTNNTCGLHVHLDMRNRSLKNSYNKLLNFQDILFGLVNSDRWDNEYCMYNNKDSSPNNKYLAFNRDSYRHLKTLEVRLHHGTTNIKQVEKWVNLLIKIIEAKKVPKMKNVDEVYKVKFLKKSDKQYIKNNFKKYWFNFKKPGHFTFFDGEDQLDLTDFENIDIRGTE